MSDFKITSKTSDKVTKKIPKIDEYVKSKIKLIFNDLYLNL